MTQEFKQSYDEWVKYLEQLGYRKVVLCKDCKHHWDDDRCEMMPNMIETDDDWWCRLHKSRGNALWQWNMVSLYSAPE